MCCPLGCSDGSSGSSIVGGCSQHSYCEAAQQRSHVVLQADATQPSRRSGGRPLEYSRQDRPVLVVPRGKSSCNIRGHSLSQSRTCAYNRIFGLGVAESLCCGGAFGSHDLDVQQVPSHCGDTQWVGALWYPSRHCATAARFGEAELPCHPLSILSKRRTQVYICTPMHWLLCCNNNLVTICVSTANCAPEATAGCACSECTAQALVRGTGSYCKCTTMSS